jgi:hypothetical protein
MGFLMIPHSVIIYYLQWIAVISFFMFMFLGAILTGYLIFIMVKMILHKQINISEIAINTINKLICSILMINIIVFIVFCVITNLL